MQLATKIVFVSYSYWPPQFGGELKHSIERFRELAARGFDITILTSGHPDYPEMSFDGGLLVLRSPSIGKSRLARIIRRLLFVFWAFYKLCRADFDIYHQGDAPGIDPYTSAIIVGFFTAIAHLKGAATVFVHSLAHSELTSFDVSGWSGIGRYLFYANFDSVVAISPGLYRDIYAKFPKSATLITYGVQDDVFVPLNTVERLNFRSNHDIDNGQVVFSFLGTVGFRKGFDVLARAFADLAQIYPFWRLWVIGPNTTQHSQNLDPLEVAEVTHHLTPVDRKVTYWGRVDDRSQLRFLLGASDVFIFPSRREGMGLAPIEAMATGTPVIVSRIPDITTLANLEDITGMYVEPGNVTALANAMCTLGGSLSLRQRMGEAGRMRVKEAFGWHECINKWEGLYLELVRRKN